MAYEHDTAWEDDYSPDVGLINGLKGFDRYLEGVEPELRQEVLRESAGELSLDEFFGHRFLIDCSYAHAPKPDKPKRRIAFEQGLFFEATGVGFAYYHSKSKRGNGVSLEFSEVDIWDPGADDDASRLHKLSLLVPVKAIRSCSSADDPDSGLADFTN